MEMKKKLFSVFNNGSVAWRIFSYSAAALAFVLALWIGGAFVYNVIIDNWIRPAFDGRYWEDRHISNTIVYQWKVGGDRVGRGRVGRLYDEASGKVLMRNIDWVAVSDDNDSLAVFAKGRKRGYLNRFTGEVAIPLEFTRAWVFSEGLAAVEKDGRLMFIDHSGKVVIDNGFMVHSGMSGYAFHNGYCIVREPVAGKAGLIDRSGNWALEPVYDNVVDNSGFWEVEKDGLFGLFSAELDTILTVSKMRICIFENMIEAGTSDNISRLYDFEGNLIEDFRIDGVDSMYYETEELIAGTGEYDEYTGEYDTFDIVYDTAECLRYYVNPYGGTYCYGLMDRQGRRVTGPLYSSISAIGKDRYLCQPDGIIIDGKGRKIE